MRYAMAAEQGCPDAQVNLGWLISHGDVATLPGESPQALAMRLWLRAGHGNHSDGWLLAAHAATALSTNCPRWAI